MPVPINSSKLIYTPLPKEDHSHSIRNVSVEKPGSLSYPFIPKTVGVLQPAVLHPIQMEASLQRMTPPAKSENFKTISKLPQTFEHLNQQGLCQTDCLSDTDTDLSAAYTHESDRDSNTSSTSDATVFETLQQIKKDCRAADQKNILIKVMRKGKQIDVITTLNENFKCGFILNKDSNCVTRFAENPISDICVGDQILDVQTYAAGSVSNTSSTSDATVFETLEQIKKDCRAADQKNILIKVMRTGEEIDVITTLNENFKYGFILHKESNCVIRFAENPIPGICVGDQILDVKRMQKAAFQIRHLHLTQQFLKLSNKSKKNAVQPVKKTLCLR